MQNKHKQCVYGMLSMQYVDAPEYAERQGWLGVKALFYLHRDLC